MTRLAALFLALLLTACAVDRSVVATTDSGQLVEIERRAAHGLPDQRLAIWLPPGYDAAHGEVRADRDRIAGGAVVSDRYLAWLADTLKPQIDRDYPGTEHEENAWAARLPGIFRYLPTRA